MSIEEEFEEEVRVHGGMTLRDYLAMKALEKLLNEETMGVAAAVAHETDVRPEKVLSHMAYEIANAMMKERQ